MRGFTVGCSAYTIVQLTDSWYKRLGILAALIIEVLWAFGPSAELRSLVRIVALLGVYLILNRQSEYHSRYIFLRNHLEKEKLRQHKQIIEKELPTGVIVVRESQEPGCQLEEVMINDKFYRTFLNKKSNEEILRGSVTNLEQLSGGDLQRIFGNIVIGDVIRDQRAPKRNKRNTIYQQQSLLDMVQQHFDEIRLLRSQEKDEEEIFYSRQYINCVYREHPEQISEQQIGSISSTPTINFEKTVDIKVINIRWKKEISLMIIFEDVSVKLKNFRNKKLHKFKQRLINSISHNLKTPLNGIMLLSEAGENEDNQAVKNEYFADIQRNGQILLNMVQQIINQQRQFLADLRVAPFSLRQLLRDVAWLFAKQLSLKEMSLAIKVADAVDRIENDEERLKFVLIQLVENSIKYSARQKHVRLEVREDPGGAPDRLEIEIADQGYGISEEKIKRLSRPIEDQFSLNDDEDYTCGIGFGLSVCQKSIKEIGPKKQDFHIESALNEGSRIRFHVFRALGSRPEHQLRASSELPEATQGVDEQKEDLQEVKTFAMRSMQDVNLTGSRAPRSQFLEYVEKNYAYFSARTRLLIVDDMAYNIYSVRMVLKKIENLEILEAENGQRALEIIDHNLAAPHELSIQIVLMDIHMPIMDGIQATEILKQKYGARLKIYIVTAFSDTKERPKARLATADGFIPTPGTLKKLYQTMTLSAADGFGEC